MVVEFCEIKEFLDVSNLIFFKVLFIDIYLKIINIERCMIGLLVESLVLSRLGRFFFGGIDSVSLCERIFIEKEGFKKVL